MAPPSLSTWDSLNEAYFKSLISGEWCGILAGLVRSALSVASIGYGCGVRIRNGLFDLGIKQTHGSPVPIISVGNITAGGTGKTPFVAYLARWFADRGVKVGLISRGYRSHSPHGNDEKLVLDQLCPGVPHLQNKDRVSAAKQAYAENNCEFLILDDGFQHRRLKRDLNIVLIDALNPWGFGRLLPRGLLREPVAELRRADLVAITRVDQTSPEKLDQIRRRISKFVDLANCIEVAFRPSKLINSDGETRDLLEFASTRITALCGIGNPDSFHQTLVERDFLVAGFEVFRDHHEFSKADLERVAETARTSDSTALICTQKDLVKIDTTEIGGLPIWAIEIAMEVQSGNDILEQQLCNSLDTQDAQ